MPPALAWTSGRPAQRIQASRRAPRAGVDQRGVARLQEIGGMAEVVGRHTLEHPCGARLASRPSGSFTRRHDGATTFPRVDLGAEA